MNTQDELQRLRTAVTDALRIAQDSKLNAYLRVEQIAATLLAVVDVDACWHDSDLPIVGKHVEVEVGSGQLLRGCVVRADHRAGTFDSVIVIRGPEALPVGRSAEGRESTWWTWPKALADDERRVRWRYSTSSGAREVG